MAKENEVVVRDNSVEGLIAQAIDKDLPIEKMERFFAMRNEWIAQENKKQFDVAMSNFQGDIPTIKKEKTVKTNTGVKAYSYAPIESIVRQVQDLLKREKLSYSFKIDIMEKGVKAICIVKHISGHTETSEMQVPLGNKTNVMSDSQVVAAASTFAKRYAFCNAFGIMTADEDTDGAGTGKTEKTPAITKTGAMNDKAKIVYLLKQLGIVATPADIKKQIKKLVDVELADDKETLEEVVARLEVLVNEKKQNADA